MIGKKQGGLMQQIVVKMNESVQYKGRLKKSDIGKYLFRIYDGREWHSDAIADNEKGVKEVLKRSDYKFKPTIILVGEVVG